jgi:tetratricopeptide (TPR) repeat protein
LLEQALEADSTFAMAYRRLSVAYFITGTQRARQIWAARKAFDNRHRLTPVERYLTEGLYYERVEPDREKATAAYKSVLEDLDPRNEVALVNLALIYNQTRRYPEAEQLAVLGMRVGGTAPIYAHATYAQVSQGKFAAAETTLTSFSARLPAAPNLLSSRARVAVAKRDYARGAMYYDSLLRVHRAANWRVVAQNGLADLALIRGRLADAERWRQEAMMANEARGAPDGYLAGALHLARVDLRHRNDPGAALHRIESALARHPLATIPVIDRPYVSLAELYAAAGRVADARRMLTAYNASEDSALRRADAARHGAAGAIALAEGRMDDALAAFRMLAAEGTGPFPGIVQLAELFDRAGKADSAIVYYERFISAHDRFAATLLILSDVAADAALVIGPSYRRLGELHERRGDREKAIDYYTRFVELWKDADPELQPQVRDVRSRLVTLARTR